MIFIAQDPSVFLKKAAQTIMESTSEAIEARKKASWALCGGKTPGPLYSLLAETYYRDRIDWKNVLIFWGDERCVPPDHIDSNYKLAKDLLLSKVPIPAVNIHRIAGESATAQEAAKAYEQDLKVQFRFERPFPKLDVMLLGMGDDGHTASLFNGSSALDEKEKWVVGQRVAKLSSDRVTVTFPVINNARKVLILCAGENKATVVRDVFWDEAPRGRYPIQRVKSNDSEVFWILDRAAASKLTADAQKKAQYI